MFFFNKYNYYPLKTTVENGSEVHQDKRASYIHPKFRTACIVAACFLAGAASTIIVQTTVPASNMPEKTSNAIECTHRLYMYLGA